MGISPENAGTNSLALLFFLAIRAGFLYSLYGADGFLLTSYQCGTPILVQSAPVDDASTTNFWRNI